MIHDHWGAALSATERRAAEIVVDLDAAETTCPACLTAFAPEASPGRCPDCGLALG